MNNYSIAVIPGDGIGKEVVPAAQQVIEVAGQRFGFSCEWQSFDWGCERFASEGAMMPEDGLQQLRRHDAIFLGAVGYPGVPDHVSLWGLLIPIRREFEQFINLRPVRLLAGIQSPLANRTPEDIDFVVVRENTEGEYVFGNVANYFAENGMIGVNATYRLAPSAPWPASKARLSAKVASRAYPLRRQLITQLAQDRLCLY